MNQKPPSQVHRITINDLALTSKSCAAWKLADMIDANSLADLQRAVSRSGVARIRLKEFKQQAKKLGSSTSLPEISRSPIRSSVRRQTGYVTARRLPDVPSEQQLLNPRTVRVDSDLHKMRLQNTLQLRQRAASRKNREKVKKKLPKTGIFKPRKVSQPEVRFKIRSRPS